jgi:hypothetical protein
VGATKIFRRIYAEFFSLFCTAFRAVLGPIQWVPGQFPPCIERTGTEDDHSHPSTAEVKNSRLVPPFHSVFFLGVLLN